MRETVRLPNGVQGNATVTLPRWPAPSVNGVTSETDFRLITESIPHIVWTASPDGSTQYLNRRGTDYTGLPHETDRSSWFSFVHPDDVGRAEWLWERANLDKKPYDVEERLRRADGEYRWHAVRAAPSLGAHGEVLSWIGTATDIDEHRHVAEALRAAEMETAWTLNLLEALESAAPVGFGFVDRDFRILRINENLAAISGGPVSEQLGRTVADVVPGVWARLEPLYRKVLDDGEPVLNVALSGSSAERAGRLRHWLTSCYPVRENAEIIGIGLVVVDVTEMQEAGEEQRELTNSVVSAIAATVEARDPYTAGHQHRVADIATAIAKELGIDADEAEGIRLAAEIHDIGKVRIPAEILTRSNGLRPAEWELIKAHPQDGYDIVAGIRFPWPVAEMILEHHERWDGSGYPRGLRGDEITIGARIIAVADTVEAMATQRPYRPGLGIEAALAQVAEQRGVLFEPRVVDACVRLFDEGRLPVQQLRHDGDRA